ncbi:hypothetical protein L596_026778 [Steinernema carpocapsae]|uniref:7TM GPCR serpentine receptor class x (Srx) domain-containing protein n=1 Tax=Steinernema carpocapsae TaxID=34508 RepID=A0A4U5M2C3_STECR|nr:hypothetical protein L596_026778 [Steinernema carpocapsae]
MVSFENVLIGSVYSVLAFILMIVNVLVFVTISVNSEFYTNSYKIIKIMIIGCLIQLVSHFIGGAMTIVESTCNYYVNTVITILTSNKFQPLLAFWSASWMRLVFILRYTTNRSSRSRANFRV